MTVAADTTFPIKYSGTGSTGPFSITSPFLKDTDLIVTKTATGVTSTLTLNTHYTLTGAGNPLGGALTLVSALLTGEILTIDRQTVRVQQADLINTTLDVNSIEASLDRLTLMVQDLKKEVNRCIKVPIDSQVTDVEVNDLIANEVLTVDNTGTAITGGLQQTTTATIVTSGLATDDFLQWDGTDVRYENRRYTERVSTKDKGVPSDGVTDARAALDSLFTTYSNRTIYFNNGTYLVNSNLTIPSTVNVEFDRNAKIKLATGVTLTINCPFFVGETQVFDCQGTSTVSGLKYASATWFGAVGNGSADDTIPLQKTLDTNAADIFFPKNYKITDTIYTDTTGNRILGRSTNVSYLQGSLTSNKPLLSIRGAQQLVERIHFQPQNTTTNSIAIQGANKIQIGYCRFLVASGASGNNIAILMDDRDENSNFVAGAYNHYIHHCSFGSVGYEYARCIDTAGTSGGINATIISECNFIGNKIIRFNNGGGNVITDCLGQATGASSIFLEYNGQFTSKGNYIDTFDTQYKTLGASARLVVFGDSWDNSTTKTAKTNTTDASPVFYADAYSGLHNLTLSSDTYNGYTSISSSGSTFTPTRIYHKITGNGAYRTGTILSTTGVLDGQLLILTGETWPVEFVASTTTIFERGENAVVVGNDTTRGGVSVIGFIYLSGFSKWVEIFRTYQLGNSGKTARIYFQDITANAQTINAETPVTRLTTSGNYTGLLLENGSFGGQDLTIVATTSSNTLDITTASNVVFGTGGAPTLGLATTNEMSISFIWDATSGKWRETARVVVP